MSVVIKLDKFRNHIEHPVLDAFDRFKNELIQNNLQDKYKACCVCGWNKKEPELIPIEPMKYRESCKKDNILPLCLNHEVQLDLFDFDDLELSKIQEFLWTICYGI